MTVEVAYWRYGCALGEGRLLIERPATAAAPQPPDAVALAQALASCEPLLGALEAWCGTGLDPQPLALDEAAPAAPQAPAVTVHAGDLVDTPSGLRLQLPLAWLAEQAPPPPGLLRWPVLALQVEVAAYAQDALPLPACGGVDGGGALLLPGAFEPRWSLRLLWAAQGLAWSGSWGGPGSAISVSPAAPQPLPGVDEEGAAGWRVLLDEPWRLPLPALLGWPAEEGQASMPPQPRGADGQARLLGPGVDRVGRIVPVLQGAALLLPADGSSAWT